MDVNYTSCSIKKIKFGLVFFCLALALACGRHDGVDIVQVAYEDEEAIGITFKTAMDVGDIRVFLGEESQTAVLGVIDSEKDKHRFTPAIPFTSGQTYTFRNRDTLVLASFTIPKRDIKEQTEILGIYPTRDTIPENLLKLYFEFAQPMQEVGNALDFITVTDETDGTEIKPFLRLESELWNKEHTILTLWLDPGRIKTDLIPNRERGLPLNEGKRYKLAIDSSWKSRQGIPLRKKYTKSFYVGPRDDKRPNIDDWQLRIRDGAVIKTLTIDFGEPMDAFLARETVGVYAPKGVEINGDFKLENKEATLVFMPKEPWKSGNYELRVQARLEDLAGNNLNRLFDTDLKKVPEPKTPKDVIVIPFEVQ